MPTHLFSRHRGLTLIEVMIGMVIGLIGIIIITQVYLVNESYKRSTTGAGGAQVNGAIALYTLERDLRMAGYGIASSDALGCGQIQYYYNGAYSSPPGSASGALPPMELAPVVITDGGAGPDTITVMYSTDAERIVPATLSKSMPTASAELNLDNPTGFSDNPGDLIILSQGGVCTLMQVTQVQVSALKLQHNPGGTALWNPAGGGSLFPAYSQGTSVFNLGRPLVNTYSISSSSLQLLSMFTASSTTVVPSYNATPVSLISDIVDLQAQYGKDNGVNNGTITNASYTANDGIVDSYDTVKPATAAAWQQVLSIRIGVLARSQNYEKPDPPGGACTATTVAPTWQGGTFAVPGGIPSCYKYRAFETVVPLRNMIWRQS
ncbi:MAG: PilW family protein [Burkholderiales bacterium]|nr:PilW family protein [Burkholderiales bacterium]